MIDPATDQIVVASIIPMPHTVVYYPHLPAAYNLTEYQVSPAKWQQAALVWQAPAVMLSFALQHELDPLSHWISVYVPIYSCMAQACYDQAIPSIVRRAGPKVQGACCFLACAPVQCLFTASPQHCPYVPALQVLVPPSIDSCQPPVSQRC